MGLVEWVMSLFGMPQNSDAIWIMYVIGAVILLIFIDAIFTFLIGAVSSLFYGGGSRR